MRWLLQVRSGWTEMGTFSLRPPHRQHADGDSQASSLQTEEATQLHKSSSTHISTPQEYLILLATSRGCMLTTEKNDSSNPPRGDSTTYDSQAY